MWRLIRLKLRVGDPTPFGLFLGCRHEMGEVRLGPSGPIVRTMTYNVEPYLRDSVGSYLSLLPQGTRLKTVSTPFLASVLGPDVRAPEHVGASLQCPWCRGAFPESAFTSMTDGHVKRRKTASGIQNPATPEPPTRGGASS